MRQIYPIRKVAGLLMLVVCWLNSSCRAQEVAQKESTQHVDVIVPTSEILRPFNGKDLDGFTKWLQATGAEDPQTDYRVTDGMIHIEGRGMGYLATVDAYQDYHLRVEYKWGKRTDGSKYVRNSGILLHATGPVRINGTIVNECCDVSPRAGRILLENEKNEIYFRNLEIRPLNRNTQQEDKP